MYRSPYNSSSQITCKFKKNGNWAAGYHTGIDLVGKDKQLYSIGNGIVSCVVFNHENYGNYLIIKLDDGNSVLYAHLHSICVKTGEKVLCGTHIGFEGNTGKSSGSHLHIEIQKGNWKYNCNLLDPTILIDLNKFDNITNTYNEGYFEMKKYVNGSIREDVFETTGLKNKIGSLDPKEVCECYGIIDNRALVVYKVSGTNERKSGFVKWLGGVQG